MSFMDREQRFDLLHLRGKRQGWASPATYSGKGQENLEIPEGSFSCRHGLSCVEEFHVIRSVEASSIWGSIEYFSVIFLPRSPTSDGKKADSSCGLKTNEEGD
ncbi:hypothetical protein CIHG_04673 [Coccidioides immitis H538.4]|uniref:Uncharacterized protein n=2 Tax=Coccidioides immitis TaxID=5501 RepID=A0A0J8RTG4_COCIT|nr:hypothetical protein CIRG_08095 [Coccidioides immitis RMSCC 2394]KMU87229.1 hypothetical protein CIHG_04673 [Coccidioides immitis H538.4]